MQESVQPPKTLEEIQTQYVNLVTRIGDLTYRAELLDTEKNRLLAERGALINQCNALGAQTLVLIKKEERGSGNESSV